MESWQEVEEGETSRTECLSSKVSIGEPTGSEIDVATSTDLEIKPKVDEGETSRPKAGSPHSRSAERHPSSRRERLAKGQAVRIHPG